MILNAPGALSSVPLNMLGKSVPDDFGSRDDMDEQDVVKVTVHMQK